MPLAWYIFKRTVRNHHDSNPDDEDLIYKGTAAERSNSAIVPFSDERLSLHSIYSLKLENAHSRPGNFRSDKTVYIITHERLGCRLRHSKLQYLLKKGASLALDLNDFGCEISIKQKIATASKIQEKLH